MLTAIASRARAIAAVLCLAFCAAMLFAPVACLPPRPRPNGPAVTPSSWVDTARTVVGTLRWAVPGARLITDAILPEPARTVVGRTLDVVGDAAGRLDTALSAYEARGGDRCAATAAVAGVRSALVGAAQALTDNGVALGVVLERVVDTAAALVDELVPGCDPDAGWSSAGRASDADLRAFELRATARGVILRRDLDHLSPPDASAR